MHNIIELVYEQRNGHRLLQALPDREVWLVPYGIKERVAAAWALKLHIFASTLLAKSERVIKDLSVTINIVSPDAQVTHVEKIRY